jgi:NAD(P)-dependent dehydrogenase (short-subunit alcohol dehydrogenase family)
MEGRVAVVTGGTTGIGLEVVWGLAARGAHTVIVGRGGAARLEQIVEEVRVGTGNPDVEAVGVQDLALRSSWPALAQELTRRLPALHVLVHNAGALYTRRETTPEGLERTFALNVLAPLALTAYLQGTLRASAPARVVNVASAAHEGHTVHLDDLESTGAYSGFGVYGRSKLELVLLSRELARRFAGSRVTVNALHPGFVRSGFGLNNRGGTALVIRAMAFLFGKSPRSGAVTPLRVACDRDLEHVSGEYFSGGHIATGSNASRDLAMARRLYERCLPLTGAPEIPLPPELRN